MLHSHGSCEWRGCLRRPRSAAQLGRSGGPRRRAALLLLTSQMLCAATIGISARDDLNNALNKRVTNYNLGETSFLEALVHVAGDFHIPMGVAWVNTPAARAPRPFEWRDVTVKQMIEAIAATPPGYQVQMSNGVMHVFPLRPILERENFLTLKIPSFEVHDAPTELASERLFDTLVPQQVGGFSLAANADDPRISLRLKDSTVEQVLDAIVLASARKIWIATFSDDTGLTSTGLRRTETLWNNLPVPDKGQPVWNLLHWNERGSWAIPIPK